MEVIQLQNLLNQGFSIIPVSKDKTPLIKWKDYQEKPAKNISDFKVKSDTYAIVCGVNNVEIIDVDLKILPLKEQRDKFKNELFELLDSHIDDFNTRFPIIETKNNGYHIIYRASNHDGNRKLATLEGHKEAIIETRGVGGYAVMYDQSRNDLSYDNIPIISDLERNTIISVCKSLNEVQDIIQVEHKTEKKYTVSEATVTPWQDFNNKNSVYDIVRDDFTVVKDTSNKILLKRTGAKSPYSGYIFKDKDIMYIFSTATQYEAEKGYTAFSAYVLKHFFGDFSKAASHLYSKGYGDRIKVELPQNEVIIRQQTNNKNEFPIEIFPDEVAHYIRENNRTLSNSIDYMGCALLWACSLMIGNSLRVQIKTGWREISTIWISIVGDAGIGKSPSLNAIVAPLEAINAEEIRRYQAKRKEFDEYLNLTKQEKQLAPEITKPQRSQFIVDDVTIEALINLHSQNHNGVGVLKDELAGWFKDMNKYKEGSDKEQWLSSWSGKGISVDRITRQSDYISKPIFPVLGGIQPSILKGFFTDENKDSGFLDRMLFTYPDLKVENYVSEEMKESMIEYYNSWCLMLFKELRKIVNYDEDGNIDPTICKFDAAGQKEWIRVFNKITKIQNSDDTHEFLKPMYAKQKSYIARFALIINTVNSFHNGIDYTIITKESILKAEKLSEYFAYMNEKIVIENINTGSMLTFLKEMKGGIPEKIEALFKANPKFSRKNVAKELNVSVSYIYGIVNKIKNK